MNRITAYSRFKILNSERADDYFGYIDSTGRPRYWRGAGTREKPVAATVQFRQANLYIPVIQKPSQFAVDDTGTYIGATTRVKGFSTAGYNKTEGYYAVGSSTPMISAVGPLDSLFRFGYIRMFAGVADELTQINSMIIRSVKSGKSDVLKLDYNLNPPGVTDLDFNADSGQWDLGIDPLNYINHTVRLIGTLDGETEFMVHEPELVDFQQASRMYATSVSGVWTIVEIGAAEVGQTYHIRTFELTGTSGGRYL